METDLSFYHPTDALLDAFTRLADPARCGARLTVDNLRDAEDPAFTLRVATFSSISFEQDEPETPRPRILLNFGAHGRELITSEVALRLASMLCGEAPSLFVDGDAERSRERISELLRQVEVKLVPTQVPSARRLAEVGAGSCKQRRLNSRGVDVNRNWDVAWAEGDEAEGSGQYRGPRAFSEPETRALARLATDWRPDVFADVRSGDRYMAMPYAHKASGPSNRGERQAMQAGLRAVTRMWQRAHPRLLAHGSVPAGPAASLGEEPYRATGTALDYMYMSAGVRRCYMLQVYGASTVYGVGGRVSRGIGRVPSSASVINLLELPSPMNATWAAGVTRNATARNAATAQNATAAHTAPRRRPVLHLRQWRHLSGRTDGALVPQPSDAEHTRDAALAEMEAAAEARQRRRRDEVPWHLRARGVEAARGEAAAVRSPPAQGPPGSFISLAEGVHVASAVHVQEEAWLETEERAESRHQRNREPRATAADTGTRTGDLAAAGAALVPLHGMPQPAHEAQPAQHGRHDVSRILHLETPRFVRTSSNQREPELASSFIAIQEEERAVRVGGSGLSAGLDSEEKPFDCVAFFNPTTFDEFEVTVNAWADALLVLIDSSLTPVLAS